MACAGRLKSDLSMNLSGRFFLSRWKLLAGLTAIPLMVMAWILAGPYHPIEPLPHSILDMHCHAAGVGAGGSGCYLSVELRRSWRFGIYMRSFGVTEEEVLRSGEGVIIDRISQLKKGHG